MSKFAIELTQTLTRTIIVEGNDYLDAKDKLTEAYFDGKVKINKKNSIERFELKDKTKEYIQSLGKKKFLNTKSQV